MYILGINAYHGDSSAALVHNGTVVAAAEEERFVRQKHWAGLPGNAIQFCLDFAGIGFEKIARVGINSDNGAHRWDKIMYLLSHPLNLGLVWQNLRTRSNRRGILEEIGDCGHDVSTTRLHAVEHHLAHLASAYYASGFEHASLMSVDGFGDFSSAAWGTGRGDELGVEGYIIFPHSLGIFYQAITQFLGFPNYGDEYKVMGLSSYGNPEYTSHMEKILKMETDSSFKLDLKYFRHHSDRLSWQWQGGCPVWDNLYSSELEFLLGPSRQPGEEISRRHKNIAASAQRIYETVFLGMLENLHAKTRSTNLALAGGCAMNSVANGKIRSATPFQNIYVQPAAGDAGGAIGAALVVSAKVGESPTANAMSNAYLGPEFGSSRIESALQAYRTELSAKNIEITSHDENSLLKLVAGKIAAGAITGWFQGRMEWGPRALGNRSILADPRSPDMQQILNQKIKRRESFRPFAPSVLSDQVSDWFETDDDVPFMEKVYPVKKDRRSQIPAVTHVDGSGRLQTVDITSNPRYYRLISEFGALTGVPILLNTSFNENEPIVCTPEEALQCFLRTSMDLLVLGDICLSRNTTA